MRSRILLIFVAIMLVAGLVITGCAEPEEERLSFHVLLPNAPTDGGWNQGYYEDTERLIKNFPDFDITYTLEFDEAAAKAIIERQAAAGVDVIFHELSVWYSAADIFADYPDVRFACENAVPAMIEDKPSNVFGFVTRQEQGGYLAGVVAGMMTKTNKLAYVAGLDYPDIVSIGYGFGLGARSVNPDVTLSVIYTGSFEDIKAGYEAARTVIDLGCDVILMFADEGNFGIIDAAEEEDDIYLVGEARDQREFSPDRILTSYNVDHYSMMEAALYDAIAGKPGPYVRYFGLQEGIEVLYPYGPMVPADVQAKVEEAKGKIMSGELVVPFMIDGERLVEEFR